MFKYDSRWPATDLPKIMSQICLRLVVTAYNFVLHMC